jgi:hypothetical protein
MSETHDPTGHVLLGIAGWVCSICGKPVELDPSITDRWVWRHHDTSDTIKTNTNPQARAIET